jgi:hypothetical protein
MAAQPVRLPARWGRYAVGQRQSTSGPLTVFRAHDTLFQRPVLLYVLNGGSEKTLATLVGKLQARDLDRWPIYESGEIDGLRYVATGTGADDLAGRRTAPAPPPRAAAQPRPPAPPLPVARVIAPPPRRGVSPWTWAAVAGGAAVLVLGVVLFVWLRVGQGTPNEKTKPPPPPSPAPPEKQDPEFDRPWTPEVDPALAIAHVEQDIEVDGTGNARFTAVIKLPPDRHQNLKRMMSRPYLTESRRIGWLPPKFRSILRFLDLESANSVTEDLQGSFDKDAIHVRAREIGQCKQRGGQWVYPVTADRRMQYRLTRLAYPAGVPTVTLKGLVKSAEVQVVAEIRLALPHGAHEIRLDGAPQELFYKAKAPPPKSGGGSSKPSIALQTKPHVMSALYKIYGDRKFHKFWVARSLFRNPGDETLTNYRVRFRLNGYSDWSRWETSDLVLPGQTVVDPFYPVIDGKVRDLRGETPVDVQVQYSYVRPNGKREEGDHAERTKLLGMNEGVYSDLETDKDSTWHETFKDAPLVLASFTSASDPVIQGVVGLLSKATGRAAVKRSDEEAMMLLRALYNLMRVNIAHEIAPVDMFEGLRRQHLKYGRDVVRTKSGTCVNTSIFFASVVEAMGLEAFIWVVPGHAFAGARLPKSRQWVAVETTGCGGGTWETSLPFDEAVQRATQTAQKWRKVGLIQEVNIRQLRQRGVHPPELGDAGTDPLKDIKPPPGAEPSPGKSAAEYYQEGKEHAEQKRWAEAEASFTRAIEQDGTKSDYYSSRANSFIELGDSARRRRDMKTWKTYCDRAGDDLQKALDLDPDSSKAFNIKGVLFNRLGRHREALEFYTQAIQLNPRNALAYKNRSITYGKLGDRRRAQADLKRAKELER